MFLFLNRLLRLCVIAGYLAAAWGIWLQRERARPLWDQYELWRDVNWTSPVPLPRLEVTVVRLLGESIVQVRAADGRPWNIALEAVEVGGLPVSKETQLWLAQNRTNLALQWTGQPVSWAWTQTNANRTGRGFLYLAGTNILEGGLREGRLGFKPELARVLPVKEQLRLRQAYRAGQAAGAGRWEWLREPSAAPPPAPRTPRRSLENPERPESPQAWPPGGGRGEAQSPRGSGGTIQLWRREIAREEPTP